MTTILCFTCSDIGRHSIGTILNQRGVITSSMRFGYIGVYSILGSVKHKVTANYRKPMQRTTGVACNHPPP